MLEDHLTAPINDALRATLTFLKKLTLEPAQITSADVRELLALGISRDAIRDAIYVCYLFCTYDRLADALGWALPNAASRDASARMLLKRGYL